MFQLDGPTLLGLAAVLGSVSNIIVTFRRISGPDDACATGGKSPLRRTRDRRQVRRGRKTRQPALPKV